RRAGQRQLVEQHELEEHRALLAAVYLRPRHGQPPALGQRAQERARVRARAVARVHPIDGEALGRVLGEEASDLGREGLLLGGEREVHGKWTIADLRDLDDGLSCAPSTFLDIFRIPSDRVFDRAGLPAWISS